MPKPKKVKGVKTLDEELTVADFILTDYGSELMKKIPVVYNVEGSNGAGGRDGSSPYGPRGGTTPVHIPPTGVNGRGEIIGCQCEKCMYKQKPSKSLRKKASINKKVKGVKPIVVDQWIMQCDKFYFRTHIITKINEIIDFISPISPNKKGQKKVNKTKK